VTAAGGPELRLAADRVIDGTGAAPVTGLELVIRDGRIAAIEPARPEVGATRYPGATILPGLVDAHVHLSLPGDARPYEQMAMESDEQMVAHGLRNAAIHLGAGVTTVRDNGSRNRVGFEIRDRIRAGAPGPRTFVSGRPVTQRGGHLWWCNGEADTAAECRGAVDRLVAEGADHIKIMASGGGTAGTNPGAASYPLELLRLIVGASRGHQRRTTAHCRAADAVDRAVAADVDCIEHVEFLTPDGSAHRDATLVRRIALSDTWLSPTLQAYGAHTLERLRSADSPGEAAAAAEIARLEAQLARRLDDVRAFLDAGLEDRILFGTDAGPFDVEFGRPGLGLRLLTDAGLTTLQALTAATSRPSRAMGIDGDVGSLEVGKAADVLVVDGDPSSDIGALDRVLAVYQGGRLVAGARAA
jgi:imidazolonepropionase-like amidohydrolase